MLPPFLRGLDLRMGREFPTRRQPSSQQTKVEFLKGTSGPTRDKIEAVLLNLDRLYLQFAPPPQSSSDLGHDPNMRIINGSADGCPPNALRISDVTTSNYDFGKRFIRHLSTCILFNRLDLPQRHPADMPDLSIIRNDLEHNMEKLLSKLSGCPSFDSNLSSYHQSLRYLLRIPSEFRRLAKSGVVSTWVEKRGGNSPRMFVHQYALINPFIPSLTEQNTTFVGDSQSFLDANLLWIPGTD